MMSGNEKCTFYELIKLYDVKIPIIQRDYAQGRKNNKEICENFLNTIKEGIVNEKYINLDFVYGNIDKNIFLPLDGQQRLTTLFLLHWYALRKEHIEGTNVQTYMKKFTYETRLSSRRFCESLVDNDILVENELIISQLILDSEWFFMSWKQDSTIRAMLNAIDIIHSVFKDVSNLWVSLTEKKLVSFNLLILENFGLSDDLYIKMNARGKLLTSFENIKAEIQDKSIQNEWETESEESDKFYHKMDNKWTDFLWENYKKNDAVDEAHMNLITTITMFQISLRNGLKTQERTEIIRKLNENNSDRNIIHYIDKDAFRYIFQVYDLYTDLSMKKMTLKIEIPFWRHQPTDGFLSQILIGDNTSYTHKVLFFAQTEYLLRNSYIDMEKFTDWMRVIRNIVSRGDITIEGKRPDIVRSPETFYGMINLVNELANGSNDIYTYLISNNINSSFAKEQIKEEILKANIMKVNSEEKKLIMQTEDNDLLRGKISFALECAGYVNDIKELDFNKLREVQIVFEKYFNRDLQDILTEEFDLLRRTMLTIEVNGKYQFYNYWWSHWYAGEAEKRKLFPLYREIEYFIGKEDFKEYFKKLINQLIVRDYRTIISNFVKPLNMDNWQFRLIKEENLLSQCKSKYIAISEDRLTCYLLKSKRPSKKEGSKIVN